MWRKQTMKKLNITKERFEKSNYFKRKYGNLEYVSESVKMFKTNKGKILKFTKEDSSDEWDDDIFKPSNELQKLYKQLKAKYGKGDIEIKLVDMQFGKFWLVVEVPEDDVKTLDKMEKILKSKC
jgi:hypothetical protein